LSGGSRPKRRFGIACSGPAKLLSTAHTLGPDHRPNFKRRSQAKSSASPHRLCAKLSDELPRHQRPVCLERSRRLRDHEYIIDYEQELGVPWKSTDLYLKLSYPFLHADRIKTPTLFLGGGNDFNVPLLNSEQMYQALRSLNVPTELIIYPGQFHSLKKPSYMIDRYKRCLDWDTKWITAKAAP
jgi:acetyl esterase/lipase